MEKSPPAKWSSQRKARVMNILKEGIDYVSSEESSDENTVLVRRPLPWLKSKYSNSLGMLDKIYYENLSKKSKGMVRQREEGEPSERPAPLNPLEYAVVNNENVHSSSEQDLDVSTSTLPLSGSEQAD